MKNTVGLFCFRYYLERKQAYLFQRENGWQTCAVSITAVHHSVNCKHDLARQTARQSRTAVAKKYKQIPLQYHGQLIFAVGITAQGSLCNEMA